MSEFPALTHVALTVSDLANSRQWYERLLDAKPMLDEDTGTYHHVVWMIGGTLIGIHEHPKLDSDEPFSEFRPGLDHVAFGCASRGELETWEVRLGDLGIPTAGIVDAAYGSGLSFRDPDNIALEFFAPPAE